jgi:hypothetical protein
VNKPRARALIIVIAGVVALAVAAAVVVFVVVKPESESLAAYDAAADELRDARRAAEEARLDLVVASDDAIATATTGMDLAKIGEDDRPRLRLRRRHHLRRSHGR